MSGYIYEQWAKAEANVIKKAEETAYIVSDNISDNKLQSIMFDMIKKYIVIGARMMEEELKNFEE